MSTNGPLARIGAAATAKRCAEQEYRAAMVAAWAWGASYREISAAAGIAKQSARMIVERARRRT